jgi:endogenous inhibitor of DNA gyrase (YacG/DUF329 family)
MSPLRECQRCNTAYQWERSQSALRFTYCGVLCEQADLGYSIDGLIRSELRRASPAAAAVADAEKILASQAELLLLL